MLTYTFESKGDIPLYEYLYKLIKEDILLGKLIADEKLPSKRGLAQHLKVSVITVENAYEQLIVEGFVYTIERSGYYVSAIEDKIKNKSKKTKINRIVKNTEDNWFFDFKTNIINADNFPFSTWAKLMREVLSEEDSRLLNPIPYNGIEKLRIAIADYLYSFRGMSIHPDQIIVGAGTEYLYSLLIQFFGKNQTYGVEDPGYQKITKIYKANGVNFQYISMDKDGLSVKELERSQATILHTTPSHHYPTGIVMPIGRRQELLKWSNEKENRYIIEDDYDSEFRLLGRPIPTLQSIDENEKVIYMNTFTKSIAPSIRISYMVLPAKLVTKYQEKLGFYSCTVPSFEQYTLAKFISLGYFEKYINRMKKFYRTQRDQVIRAVEDSGLNDIVEILEENSGLHFILKVDTKKSDKEIIEESAKEGIKISCVSEYLSDSDKRFENMIIINYSGIDTSRLKEVIRRLFSVIL